MPATIFNGDRVKALKDKLQLGDNIQIISGDSDNPSSVAKDAPQGSLYIQDGTSCLFQKLDSGSSVNWSKIENSLVTDRVMSTSWLEGGALTINADTTKFDITAGSGLIVDSYTDPTSPAHDEITWGAQTAVTVTNLGTATFTVIAIDVNGNIVQFNTPSDDKRRKEYVVLGALIHTGMTEITDISNIPVFSLDPYAQLSELANALGPLNISGNVITPNGANLNLDRSTGSVFLMRSNTAIDLETPNTFVTSANPAMTFISYYRDGSGGRTVINAVTAVDTNQYDDGSGTLQTIPNNKWTNHRMHYNALADLEIFTYGQNIYNSFSEAESALQSEAYETTVTNSSTLGRAWIIAKKGATDLSDVSEASVFGASRFGFDISGTGAVTSTTNLQQAYDNSITPEIVVNASNGALSVSDNATPIAANLLEVHNNADTTKYFEVDVDGIGGDGITASKALVSDANSKIKDSVTTSAELAHVSGVTSAIQTQIDANKSYIDQAVEINYIINPQFENGITDTDTGGAYTTVSVESTTPIRGTQSLNMNFDNGALADTDFAGFLANDIDNADIGKALYISFDYKTDANYVNDSMKVFVSNDDAAQWETVYGGNGSGLLPATNGDVSTFTGVVYLDATSNTYIPYIGADINILADTVVTVDNVVFGPAKLVDAPIVGAWEDYTATTSGISANTTFKYRRINDSIEVKGSFDVTGAATTSINFQLPSGLTLDTTKMPEGITGTDAYQDVGRATGRDSSPAGLFNGAVIRDNTSTNQFYIGTSGDTTSNQTWDATRPFTWASGDAITIHLTAPISEWAGQSSVLSNKEMLNLGDKVLADGVITSTFSSTTFAYNYLKFTTEQTDVLGGYDSSTGLWTVQKTGWYEIGVGASVTFGSAPSTAQGIMLGYSIDTGSGLSDAKTVDVDNGNGSETIWTMHGEGPIEYLQKGNSVHCYFRKNGTMSLTATGDTRNNWFSVREVFDPTVIATFPEPLKTQTKVLSADVTTNITISDLTFSNLEVGRWYETNMQIRLGVNASAADVSAVVDVTHDSAVIGRYELINRQNNSTTGDTMVAGLTIKFQATGTTLTFVGVDLSANSFVLGDSTKKETWATLTEINPLQETTEW